MRGVTAALVLGTLASAVHGWDFSNLLGRIQQATISFDQRADEVRDSEEASLRKIEDKERAVDRSLETFKEKLRMSAPPPQSLLEQRRRKHRKNRVTFKRVSFKSDNKVLEETERQREEAEKNFLAVEKQIADLPEKLTHSKERRVKEKFDVPLDDAQDDEDQDDSTDEQ